MTTQTRSTLAEALNQTCHCITLDEKLLDHALAREGEGLGVAELIASHPHLFSRTAVFIDAATERTMRSVVSAIERVTLLPRYVEQVLQSAHPHAQVEPKSRGAFMGFDFHLGQAGPQLIEINTNAGGGLLNAVLRRAQRACCEPVERAVGIGTGEALDFVEMFRQEWRLARGERPLGHIAIVDDEPAAQYLYPEFVLFRRACEANGLRATICDARELDVTGGTLQHQGQPIDMVYNRLTDFTLEMPEHAALAEAFRGDLAVVTPHPRAYALYADKLRLVLLSDREALISLGAEPADADLLARHIPRTTQVKPEDRERLWSERKSLFFKPQSGYGGRAAYRGDKITKRAFEEMLTKPYVAQALVTPSSRSLSGGDTAHVLKLDVRNFSYSGHVQLICARLYQGQTTNFRSTGGGFAPIYVV